MNLSSSTKRPIKRPFFLARAVVTGACAFGLFLTRIQVQAGPGGGGQYCGSPTEAATMCYQGHITLYNVPPVNQAFYLANGQATCGACQSSGSAYLSNLALSAGVISPSFSPSTFAYTLSVPNATSSTTVTPTVADATATVKVNDVPVASGSASNPINLSVGPNTINTVVTTQDTIATNTYTVTVTRFAAPANLPIYLDSLLNGFQDYSWATNVDFFNSTPVYSGSYSIRVTGADYTALSLYHDAFDTSPYASLSFWINGGAAGAQGVQVMGVVNQAYSLIYDLPALTANTWTPFDLPLSALGVANVTNCQGFWFWPTLPGVTTFYVDAIQLNNTTAPSLAVVPSTAGSGFIVLQLFGISGQTYWIQASTNLATWINVSTNVLAAPFANITNTTTASCQFWRAVWPQ
jgi:Cadherin-like beta sandwich domain